MVVQNIIFWGLALILLFIPLPYGAVDEWAIFLFETTTFVLFSLHLVHSLIRTTSSKSSEGRKFDPGSQRAGEKQTLMDPPLKILLAVFFVFSFIQITPLPSSFLNILSPRVADIQKGWGTLSFSPNLSVYEFLKYICYFLFAYLLIKYVGTKRHVEILILVIIASAVFQSFYGLTEYFSGSGKIFGWKNIWSKGPALGAFGTFVNRNHFSGFLEMVLPVSLGYLLTKTNFFSMKRGLSWREKILLFVQDRLPKVIILGSISILLGLGILFSRSRSGLLIFFMTIFLMFLSLSLGEGRNEKVHHPRRFTKIMRAVVLVVLFSILFLGMLPILEKFTRGPLPSRVGRPFYYKNTLKIIAHYPLFGTGLGTFAYVYPKFKDQFDTGFLDHAHNDYLEMLAESGFIGGLPIILAAFAGVFFLFRRWLKKHDDFKRGIMLGCLAGITAILIHSATDFNLRIPANAVYFVTLFALGFRVANLKTRS